MLRPLLVCGDAICHIWGTLQRLLPPDIPISPWSQSWLLAKMLFRSRQRQVFGARLE